MINTIAIDHVCLWVRSLAETKEYYEKLFSFECSYRNGDKNTLIVESKNTHFFFSEYSNESEFISKQHISFEVVSLNQVIEALEKLGVNEYQIGEVEFFTHKNYKWCEWRDPSGIRLECVEII